MPSGASNSPCSFVQVSQRVLFSSHVSESGSDVGEDESPPDTSIRPKLKPEVLLVFEESPRNTESGGVNILPSVIYGVIVSMLKRESVVYM